MNYQEQWRDSLQRIQNNDNFDYDQAISYYSKLKTRMYQQIKINSKIKNLSAGEIGLNIENELNSIYTGLTSKELLELSNNTLNDIQNYIIDTYEKKDAKSYYLNQIQKEIEELSKKKENNIKETTQKIKKLEKEIINTFYDEDKLEKFISQQIQSMKFSSDGFIDFGTIINFLTGFILKTVKHVVDIQIKQYFINKNNKTTLMGYYKEIIEKEMLQKFFNNQNLFVNVDLVAGANTINDLLLSFDNLNQIYNTEELIQILDDPSLENKMISMGVQIKARDIEKINTEFMKISHSAFLRDGFNSQLQQNDSQYSWSKGVVFLGQYKNILESFGSNNVMFISGPKRYFMDNFISNFRKKQMYLAFQMDNNHRATSQIGLQRFISKRNNTILNRFLNI